MKRACKFFADVISALPGNRRGLASVESAFFMPIFIFASLAVFDLGRAGAARMALDQALRAGAQVSMLNVTDKSEILVATLAALGLESTGTDGEDGMCAADATCIEVDFHCECIEGVATACASICTATGEPASAYMTINARRRQEGIIFPDHEVSSQIMVQTR